MNFNRDTNASYNFRSPNITRDFNKKMEFVFPTAEAMAVEQDYNVDITIDRQVSVLDLGVLTQSVVLNGIVDNDNVDIGAIVLIKAACDGDNGAKDVELSGKFSNANSIGGEVEVEKHIAMIYDGVEFQVLYEGSAASSGATTPSFEKQTPDASAGSVILTKDKTLVDFGELSDDREIELEGDNLNDGAMVTVMAACGTTAYDVQFVNAVSSDLVGVASTIKSITFMYEGGVFYQIADADMGSYTP